MRSITKQLDMSPGAVSPVVHVSQYDSDFTIVFTLYCTDGTFTLESGTTAEIRGTKKSGTGYSATATVNISAKTVTVTGHKQMTAVAGDNVYEITLYKGSKELNSINFILAVERAAMDQDTVVDETTIREFGELETYIDGVKADAAASASAANASQTAAAQSATNAANSAIEAAQSAQSVDAERLNRIAFGSYVVEESTGPIVHFEDGADNIPMKDVLVHIEPVQAGSGDPSPDNVRPITGWTWANVTRCGKNLLMPAKTTETTESNGITFTYYEDGSISATGTATANAYSYAQSGWRLPAGTYRKTPHIQVGDIACGLFVQVKESDSSWKMVGYTKNPTFTISEEDAKYDTVARFVIYAGATVDNLVLNPYIYLASDTDSTYERYSGQTYSITFPSSAGTVYGGTLDVTSGVLTVTHKLYTFDGSENWTAGNHDKRYEFNLGGRSDYFKTWHSGGRGLSNIGIYDSGNYQTAATHITSRTFNSASETGANTHVLVVPPSIATTAEELKAFLANTPEQWYAPLQTPQTYQLTPQEITSLLGQNNVWADTGDTEVEYRADTTLYIGRLTEPDADMIADSNITSGQYFMVGNSLYRATSNIASGASVVVGTNAVKVSLATALNEINQ